MIFDSAEEFFRIRMQILSIFCNMRCTLALPAQPQVLQ
jgi:hypothetical protein